CHQRSARPPARRAPGDRRPVRVLRLLSQGRPGRRLTHGRATGGTAWAPEELATFRDRLLETLRPKARPQGLSPYELTRRLRELFPRDTVLVTDVGSVKAITTQAWAAYAPRTFFESNGLSSMSYALPGAMAARPSESWRAVRRGGLRRGGRGARRVGA